MERGNVEVFNESAGRNNAKIGFMPQEISLVSEFTIREMIHLFGTIFGMKRDEIAQRLHFLSNLLDLPDNSRFIRDCSGGQQRRVSFALTLVHEPEILILDEPTVGVDPLLRSKIWDYLIDITSTKNVTVLLSTHYIEEARQSTCVGLMRNGVQIAEDSPQNILQHCGTTSLEEAFLRLSEQQETFGNDQCSLSEIKQKKSMDSFDTEAGPSKPRKRKNSSWEVMHALLLKNGLQFLRHPG